VHRDASYAEAAGRLAADVVKARDALANAPRAKAEAARQA
jgi:hypothetical protein